MKIVVPATSANLGPGFDCLGLSLKLFNEVEILPSKELIIKIKGEGENDKNLYTNNNVFVQIFYQKFFELTQEKNPPFSFHFTNKIPFSRGLGSSSAVIVSALACAYKLAKVKISKEKILNEALNYENHPDNIAPCTLGGFVCSIVENKQVLSIKKKIDDDLKALIVVPKSEFSTKKSRSTLAQNVSLKTAVFNLAHASFLTACFLEKRYELLRLASKDKLHQLRRMKALNELFDVQKLALENNALMSVLSGSGSSFFSLYFKDDILQATHKMQEKFSNFKALILEFDNNGFKFC
ncbi:homoserine kinase [Campylobacter sp. MIT 97-5078]|uniref:homoserine kinase n=1 Tax=Campylobacter sp. MIT 97-5078 TaxID=1548153 RepID=UPI0005146FDA|nr:homoserine kinase [Campylobacter sp. MIT 97-5078]KGI56594.1 serine kinase [Campylobacter sp. MIT 97-5078]TQR26816.1 homoserine kinase [Campylobacter sp. MIT 97-5078]